MSRLWIYLLTGFLLFSSALQAGFEEGLEASRAGDRETAFAEYHAASMSGDIRAFGMLGSMYLYGLGTERNYQLAYVWFAISEEIGDKTAKRYRKTAASMLSYEQIGEAEKLLQEYRRKLNMEKPAK